ncbi:MAG TPA: hypothetical protein VLG38_04760 [Gammaproteobacteria bacterium]|nr:hypothetical protein [Gammaproteobacteria bacterium]
MNVEIFVPAAARAADGFVTIGIGFIFVKHNDIHDLLWKLEQSGLLDPDTVTQTHHQIQLRIRQEVTVAELLAEIPNGVVNTIVLDSVPESQEQKQNLNRTFAELAVLANKNAAALFKPRQSAAL